MRKLLIILSISLSISLSFSCSIGFLVDYLDVFREVGGKIESRDHATVMKQKAVAEKNKAGNRTGDRRE